jgi:hypothetical protein
MNQFYERERYYTPVPLAGEKPAPTVTRAATEAIPTWSLLREHWRYVRADNTDIRRTFERHHAANEDPPCPG